MAILARRRLRAAGLFGPLKSGRRCGTALSPGRAGLSISSIASAAPTQV